MRAHILAALLAFAPACKNKEADLTAAALAAMKSFRDQMCECKTSACVQKVQEEMARWSNEMAKSSDRRPPPMSEEQQKAFVDTAQRMSECAQTALGAVPEPPQDDPPPPPPPERITNADRLIKLTYDGLGEHQVSKLQLSYVRADGTLDETYGIATVELGKPAPADDPDRPIGAPLPAAPPSYVTTGRCPSYTWKAGVRSEGTTSCSMDGAKGIARPRCSVVEVWKRAIDQGAPANALAVLELTGPPAQTWTFSIEDAPRKIHIAIEVEDTCEPTLEAPR